MADPEDGAASVSSTGQAASSSSRLSKLLGLSPSRKGSARHVAGRVQTTGDWKSNGLTNDEDAEAVDGQDSSMLVEPPTPGPSSSSQSRGRGTSYSGTPTKSRSSVYLSNILAGSHASPSATAGEAGSSETRLLASSDDANKGTVRAKLARTASKDASSTGSWRLPSWSSPSKKDSQFAPPLPEPPLSAASTKSVGLVLGPQVHNGESPPTTDASSSFKSARLSDVVDEGISMSDTTGKVGAYFALSRDIPPLTLL